MIYPNLFKQKYQLKGKNWVKTIEPDDLKVFIDIGMRFNDYGRMGGKVRGKTGKRDRRGRFTK